MPIEQPLEVRPLPIELSFILGEGLTWDCRRQRLLMTDILAKLVFEIDISTYAFTSWKMPEEVGWVLPTEECHRYAVGLRSGIATFDPRSPKQLHWINCEFPASLHIRLNDACTDSFGRIWYGSMSHEDSNRAEGKIASYEPDEGLKLHDSGFSVTNGPVINADATYLFLNDSLQGTIYRYCFSLATGTIRGREVFAQFPSSDGMPDGMCFDDSGCLWVAMWSGSKVILLDPSGKLCGEIAIPAANVTNVCFCGEALDRLIVSTAATLDASGKVVVPGLLYEVHGHGSAGTSTTPCDLAKR